MLIPSSNKCNWLAMSTFALLLPFYILGPQRRVSKMNKGTLAPTRHSATVVRNIVPVDQHIGEGKDCD